MARRKRKSASEQAIDDLIEACMNSHAAWEDVVRQIANVMPTEAVEAAIEEVESPTRRFRARLRLNISARTNQEEPDDEVLVSAIIKEIEEHEGGTAGWLADQFASGDVCEEIDYVGMELPGGSFVPVIKNDGIEGSMDEESSLDDEDDYDARCARLKNEIETSRRRIARRPWE